MQSNEDIRDTRRRCHIERQMWFIGPMDIFCKACSIQFLYLFVWNFHQRTMQRRQNKPLRLTEVTKHLSQQSIFIRAGLLGHDWQHILSAQQATFCSKLDNCLGNSIMLLIGWRKGLKTRGCCKNEGKPQHLRNACSCQPNRITNPDWDATLSQALHIVVALC